MKKFYLLLIAIFTLLNQNISAQQTQNSSSKNDNLASWTFDDANSISDFVGIADATEPTTEAEVAYEASGNGTGALSITGINSMSGVGRNFTFRYGTGSFDFKGNSQFKISFDAKFSGAYQSSGFHLGVQVPNTTGGAGVVTINNFDLQGNINSSTWSKIEVDISHANFNGSNGEFYLDFQIAAGAIINAGGTILIDNISISSDGSGGGGTDPNALDVIYSDLVWSDEFNTDGAIDNSKWYHQTFGPNGGQWFNGELQHYTNRLDNSFVQNGSLHIVAKKENFTQNGVTLGYTSARLNSKFAFTYGRVDVRAKLPAGNGTWPAIWTLGKNISETGAWFQTQGFGNTAWPACGEIDIMEHGLHAFNEVSSALHTPSSSGNTVNTATKNLPDVANTFYVYSMNWSPNQITFLIDNVPYYTYKPATQNSSTWPFNLDQFLLLNVAMGGFAGTIDAGFTQSSMEIDYVRVYQNTLSTDEVDFEKSFTIYPNPTRDYLSINTSKEIEKLEFYSILGQLVLTKQNPTKTINTQKLTPGIYLLRIHSENKIATKKILIE